MYYVLLGTVLGCQCRVPGNLVLFAATVLSTVAAATRVAGTRVQYWVPNTGTQ